RGPPAQHQLDAVLAPPLLRVQECLFARVAAGQVALGEWWPLVRRFGLLTDQHDPAGETLLAQRLGRLPAGERGSDDHKRTLIRTHADQPTARAHAGGYRHGSLPVPTRAMHTYARREATAARPAGD